MAEGKQLFDKELQKLLDQRERLRLQREAKHEWTSGEKSIHRAEGSRGLSQMLRRAMTASNLNGHADLRTASEKERRQSRARTTSGNSVQLRRSSDTRSRTTSGSSNQRSSEQRRTELYADCSPNV